MSDEAKTELFISQRQRLLGIAQRVLGVPAEAEDVVQEAYLRFHREPLAGIVSTQAWLVTVVMRLAIDRRRERQAFERMLDALDADRLLRQHPVVAPTRGEPDVGPQVVPSEETRAELLAEVHRALGELQRSLPAHEAAALLLRDVFEADYRDLAGWLGKSEEACRQIVLRARRKLAGRPQVDRPAPASDAADVRGWLQALRDRDHRSLVAVLLRAEARPQPVLASRDAAATTTGFDRHGRLVLKLGRMVLCTLPTGAGERVRCEA